MNNYFISAVFMMFVSTDVGASEPFYAGFGVGGSFPKGGAEVTDAAGNSYTGVLGFQLDKSVGFELGIGYADWKIYNNSRYRAVTANASLATVTVSMLGYFPLGEYLRIFGKLGVVDNLYMLNSCTSCPSAHVNATSTSMIRGVGMALGGKDDEVPVFRLGYENYSSGTQLNPTLSIDHVYLLFSAAI